MAMHASATGMNPSTKGSRINSDVERILSLARKIQSAQDRVMGHVHALGYDAPPEAMEGNGKVSPISNNLQIALNDLERSVDGLHGALSLFD